MADLKDVEKNHVLPDGLHVTAERRGDAAEARWAGPGCATGSGCKRGAAASASCTCSRARCATSARRRQRAHRRRARRRHLPSCRGVPLTNVVVELQEGDRGCDGYSAFLSYTLGEQQGKETMSNVIRLGFVHLRVTDLEEARNHYSNTLGMEVVPGARQALPQVLGRVGPPLAGARRGRRRAGQARLQGREPRRWTSSSSAPSSSAHHRPLPRGGEPHRRRGRADHAAVRAQRRAVHRDGVRGHRDGAINPEAWPRNVRGVGTHWIDQPSCRARNPA